MQIWIAKYGGFVSSIIFNIEIYCADILYKLTEISKSLLNTVQRNQDYMHERL